MTTKVVTAPVTSKAFSVTETKDSIEYTYTPSDDGKTHTTMSIIHALSGQTADPNRTVVAKYGTDVITNDLLELPSTTSTAETFNCLTGGNPRTYQRVFDLPCDEYTVKHVTTTHVRHTADELKVAATIINPSILERTDYAEEGNTTTKTVRFTSVAIVDDLANSHTTSLSATVVDLSLIHI